ncbi:MAG: PEP-CTERM sorting domain-containing protein [Verrucomicrobiales bacterium]
MKPYHRILLMLACYPAHLHAQSDMHIRFEQSFYVVQPNQSITLNVLIDPPPAAGLFSYGVRLRSESPDLDFSSSTVNVPSVLNFNGPLGPGALIETSGNSIGIKGTVDTSSDAIEFYSSPLLATFTSPLLLGEQGSSAQFSLEFFRTVGPSETLFVDGLGNNLDGQILFDTATITVVPEPSTIVLVVAGLFAWQARQYWGSHGGCQRKLKPSNPLDIC